MNRFQKKCLVASTGFHGFLVLLLVFGSAFFVTKEKPTTQRLNVVPTRLIENALSGGGGNPNLPQTEDRQKGETLLPQPAAAAPPPQPAPPQPKPPQPQPPQPKPEAKKAEPKKPDPTPKPPKATDVEKLKPVDKIPEVKPRIDLNELKPIARTDTDKHKAQKEAEAREADRQQKIADAQRQKLADQIGKVADTMRRGFSGGTKVEVGGPGGEAYANYGSLVQAAYEDAWKIIQDLTDDDEIAVVRVTITRDGRVVGARFVERSKSASMNKSVQRALDAVKKLPPFPEFLKEPERSFTIEFNLKAKRLLG
jgi:colicin import membrane protein